MSDSAKSRTQRASVALLLTVAAVAILLYARSWSHPFVYDDVVAVRDHPLVNGDRPWVEILTSPYWPREVTPDPLYRPLTVASFRANAFFFSHDPFNFHVTNSVLHALGACFVALLAVRLWGKQAPGWIAGLLFATHPVHTEAVVPVVGRSELLAMIFIIWMTYVHVQRVALSRPPSVTYHCGLALLYALACAAKEHGVLALAVIVAIDVWNRRRTPISSQSARRHLNELAASHYLGLIVVLTALLTMRWTIFAWQTSMPEGVDNSMYNPLDTAGLEERLATPFTLAALAVQLICLPVNLCPIWGKGGINLTSSLLAPDCLAGIAIIAGLVVAMVFTLRRRLPAMIPIAGLLTFLAIPCHFIPVANWFFAERWLYLPSAMLILTFAGIGAAAPKRALAGGVVVAAVFATMAWRYQESWRSDESMVRTVVQRQPLNCPGLCGICNLLEGRGDIEEAEQYIRRLVRHHPDEPQTWYFQARLLAERRQFSDALTAINRYVEMAQLPGLTPKVLALWKRIRQQQ